LYSGIAVGLAGTFRLLGGAVATAIYTAILSTKFSDTVPSTMTAAIENAGVDFSDSLLQGLVTAAATNTQAAFQAVQGATPQLVSQALMATKLAYVEAFKLVYLVAIAFGVLATVAAFCTISTDRSTKTMDRAVVLKNELGKSEKVTKETV
jgi:hypothetical protein